MVREQWEINLLRDEWDEAAAVADALRAVVREYHAQGPEAYAPDIVWKHYERAIDARLKASDAYFAAAYPHLETSNA